jgi:hypothetical protein
MAKLSDYLLKLSKDPDELKRFQSGRTSAKSSMKSAGLTDDHIEAVLSKDPGKIREHLVKELGGEKSMEGFGLRLEPPEWVQEVSAHLWSEPDPDEKS